MLGTDNEGLEWHAKEMTLTCSVGLCDVWESRMLRRGDTLPTCKCGWARIETHVSNLSLMHEDPEARDQVTQQKTWPSKSRTKSRSSESSALNFLHTEALVYLWIQASSSKPCILCVGFKCKYNSSSFTEYMHLSHLLNIRTVRPACGEWSHQLRKEQEWGFSKEEMNGLQCLADAETK